MATLANEIANKLAGNGRIINATNNGGLGFNVYERWLTPSGAGSTPDAFDPTRGGALKRSIVVLDGGEVEHPQGSMAGFRRWDSFPLTYIFSEAHQSGKQAAQDAYLQIEAVLVGWEAVVAGQRVCFRSDSRTSLEDSDLFPGNVVLIARWRATGVRRLVPAA